MPHPLTHETRVAVPVYDMDGHGAAHAHHRPDSNLLVWTHTGLFIQFIYCLGIMLAVNYWDNPVKQIGASRFILFYIAVCIAFPAMLMVNYVVWGETGEYLTPFWFNAVLDWTWVFCTAGALNNLPTGEALVSTTKVRIIDHAALAAADKDQDAEEELAAPAGGPLTSLLWVVFLPVVLLSILAHVASGVLKRLVNVFVRASPFLEPRLGPAGDAESGNVAESRTPGVRRFVGGGYLGDLFGFVGFLANPGMGKGGRSNRWEAGGAVYATNVGVPVVMLNDLTASRVYVEGIDNATDAHDVPVFAYSGDQYAARANFMRAGDHAVKVRQFFARLVPADSSDPKWKAAMDAVARRVRKWATYDREDLVLVDVHEEFRVNLMWIFATHMFLGASIDLSFLADNVFPMPQLSFQYPWFPAWLNPARARMNKAKGAIWTFMRHCPYAADVKAAYEAVGLTDVHAFEALLTACTFNASGMGNSALNLMYYLPQCGASLKSQLKSDGDGNHALLESFCYELLRNNGPMGIFKLKRDTALRTSAGEHYLLKSGTIVCVNNTVTQRDETVYEDPHTFRADRFYPLPPKTLAARDPATGAEPLPSMAFACQLGKMFAAETPPGPDDKDSYDDAKQHNCVFKHLAVHYLKGLALVLLEHDYGLDADTTAVVAAGVKKDPAPKMKDFKGAEGRKCPFAFDISPGAIRGGVDPSFDNTPKVGRCMLTDSPRPRVLHS